MANPRWSGPADQVGSSESEGVVEIDELIKAKDTHSSMLNYLSKKDEKVKGKEAFNVSKFRMIPECDEEGEFAPVNPDTPDEVTDITGEYFGKSFIHVEVADIYMDGRRMLFPTDADVPPDEKVRGFSPGRECLVALREKLRFQHLLNEAGLPIEEDVPQDWLRYADIDTTKRSGSNDPNFRSIPLPSSQWLIQCLVREENGQTFSDNNGWKDKVGVLRIPNSAFKAAATNILTKMEPDQPLGPDNCLFGDYCSLAGGRIVMMRKVSTGASRTEVSYVLSPTSTKAPLTVEHAAMYWRPWDEVLNIPTSYEDCVKLLGEMLGTQLVGYALGRSKQYKKYVPEEWIEEASSIGPFYWKKEQMAKLEEIRSGRANTTPAAPPAQESKSKPDAKPLEDSIPGPATTAAELPPPSSDGAKAPDDSASEMDVPPPVEVDAGEVPPPADVDSSKLQQALERNVEIPVDNKAE